MTCSPPSQSHGHRTPFPYSNGGIDDSGVVWKGKTWDSAENRGVARPKTCVNSTFPYISDLLRFQCPYISSQTVRNQSFGGDDAAGHANEDRREYEPVVEAQTSLGDEQFETQPHDDCHTRDDSQGDGHDIIVCSPIPHRHATGCAGNVLDDQGIRNRTVRHYASRDFRHELCVATHARCIAARRGCQSGDEAF